MSYISALRTHKQPQLLDITTQLRWTLEHSSRLCDKCENRRSYFYKYQYRYRYCHVCYNIRQSVYTANRMFKSIPLSRHAEIAPYFTHLHRQLGICCKILGNDDKNEIHIGHILSLDIYSRLVDNSIFFRHLTLSQSIQLEKVCRRILKKFFNRSENAIEKPVYELNLPMPLYLQNKICKELRYLCTNCYSERKMYVQYPIERKDRLGTIVRVTLSLEKRGLRKFKKLVEKLQKIKMLEFNPETKQNKKELGDRTLSNVCAVFRITNINSKILQFIDWDVKIK